MVYTDHANSVSAHSANCPGHMRTVRIVVHRIRIAVKGIDTVNIVNITVAVIINTVSSNFTWVNPRVICKVFMIVVNTRIDNADDHIAITGCNIPCFWCVNIHICSTAGLTCVIQTP